MKVLLKEAEKINAEDNCFGFLVCICNSSKFQLGALVSQSFSKRINSAGKIIGRDNQSILSDELF